MRGKPRAWMGCLGLLPDAYAALGADLPAVLSAVVSALHPGAGRHRDAALLPLQKRGREGALKRPPFPRRCKTVLSEDARRCSIMYAFPPRRGKNRIIWRGFESRSGFAFLSFPRAGYRTVRTISTQVRIAENPPQTTR